MTNPFSRKSIDAAIQDADDDTGLLEFGVESELGEAPMFTIDASGEHTFQKAELTWSAWAKTQFTKVSTAVGAKVGLKW